VVNSVLHYCTNETICTLIYGQLVLSAAFAIGWTSVTNVSWMTRDSCGKNELTADDSDKPVDKCQFDRMQIVA